MPGISHTDVHLIVTQLVKLVYLLNRGQGVDLLCSPPSAISYCSAIVM